MAEVQKTKFQEKHKYSENFKSVSGSTKKTSTSTLRNYEAQATNSALMNNSHSLSPRSDKGGILDKLEKEMA